MPSTHPPIYLFGRFFWICPFFHLLCSTTRSMTPVWSRVGWWTAKSEQQLETMEILGEDESMNSLSSHIPATNHTPSKLHTTWKQKILQTTNWFWVCWHSTFTTCGWEMCRYIQMQTYYLIQSNADLSFLTGDFFKRSRKQNIKFNGESVGWEYCEKPCRSEEKQNSCHPRLPTSGKWRHNYKSLSWKMKAFLAILHWEKNLSHLIHGKVSSRSCWGSLEEISEFQHLDGAKHHPKDWTFL